MSIKISELGNSASLTGGEYVPIVQNGATVKTTTKSISDLVGLTYTPENVANKSSNTALGTSDILYPTQNAVKTYVDAATTSLIRDRGNYDASSNQFPIAGMGSGTSGAIMAGDLWYISVAGTLGGTSVMVGYSIRALVNNPGQNASSWGILNVGLGYVPENVANKSNDGALGTSATLYPTQLAVKTYVDAHSAGLTSVGVQLSTINNGNDLSVTNSPLTSNGTISINIPNASGSGSGIRGVVSTTDQSFKGIKTFDKIKSGGIQLDITTSEYSNTGFATLWSPNTSGYNVLNIKTGSALASSLKMPNTGSYTYTFPSLTGTIALQSDLLAYVPYELDNASGKSIDIGHGVPLDLFRIGATANIFDGDVDANSLTAVTYLGVYHTAGPTVFNGKIQASDITANRTLEFPNTSGTIVVGSGTAGVIPMWLSSPGSDIGQSQILDTGTSILIGEPVFNSEYKLCVEGNTFGNGSIAVGGKVGFVDVDDPIIPDNFQAYIYATQENDSFGMQFFTTGVERIRISESGQVGIGTSSPAESAKVQINSTTQGFLPPRMTAAQIGSISSPAQGLMVYQTDSGGDGEGVYVKRSDGWYKLAWYNPL